MARLRVSGGKVWTGAGGRRGPGPVLSTTADEWRLSWDDAPAATQAGFVSALGLGALRRLGANVGGGGFLAAWARGANVVINARAGRVNA